LRTLWSRSPVRVFAALALLSMAPGPRAWAEDGDDWSFSVRPQLWTPHIAKNGFAAPANVRPVQGGFVIVRPDGRFAPEPLSSTSSPKNDVDAQWGLQFGAHKGPFNIAGALQGVDFTTLNDIKYVHPDNLPFLGLASGHRFAVEAVRTTRIDMDLAAIYLFDLGHRIDASVGAGLKFIYASAERRYTALSEAATIISSLPPPGLYTVCSDPCTDLKFRDRVQERSYLYGAIFPLGVTVPLGEHLQLPINIAPLVGAESRNDRDVVYRVDLPEFASQLRPPLSVNRQDGTTFAYGVTADASLTWKLAEMVSAHVAVRVQYFKGHDTYLAYGPLVGLSFRFGQTTSSSSQPPVVR